MPSISERVFAAPHAPAHTTNAQQAANVVTIRLKGTPPHLVVEPDPADLHYTHAHGRGDEMKPHRLVWLAGFHRSAGELLTIRLTGVTRPSKLTLAAPVFEHAFGPVAATTPTDTWLIRHDENAVVTLPLDLASDEYERIHLKYEVVLTGGHRSVPALDPEIRLIPDP